PVGELVDGELVFVAALAVGRVGDVDRVAVVAVAGDGQVVAAGVAVGFAVGVGDLADDVDHDGVAVVERHIPATARPGSGTRSPIRDRGRGGAGSAARDDHPVGEHADGDRADQDVGDGHPVLHQD